MRWLWLRVLIVSLVLALQPTATAAAVTAADADATAVTAGPPGDAVPTCRVGARLTDVYDVLPAANTFAARLWLWSLCPTQGLDPLPSASFSNSTAPKISDTSVVFSANLWYDSRLLDGTFRQDFDEDDYPFDHQKLVILFTAPQDAQHFRFVPDTASSSAAEDISVPGWRVTDFAVGSLVQDFNSNYGDPTLPPGAHSQYSRMRLEIGLARADRFGFLRSVGPLVLIFFVVSLTFAIGATDASRFSSRFATLGATLFAVLVSMQRADTIAPGRGITLIDQLHILTMAWVMVAIGMTALLWRWSAAEVPAERVARTNLRGVLVGSLVYLAGAAALIVSAAVRG
ncbi:hypothetical protein [Kitasatospora sp. LaBMicrA B282]|uniref:hypothetical protein n=1 Tax=Kitasatospora sp. LaBMicrA B282 TaxID=3420949 RepID=UPI003D12404F